MQNFENRISQAEKTLNNIRGIFEKNNIHSKLKEIEKILLGENFWKDKSKVKKTVKEKKFTKIYLILLRDLHPK